MPTGIKIRLDKWLWAARFFKTRSIAAQAVNSGKVYVNGQRVKPARIISVGDQLLIRRGNFEYSVFVQGVNSKRRPFKEALELYIETEESILKRQEMKNQLQLLRCSEGAYREKGRPSKRDRRLIRSFTGKS